MTTLSGRAHISTTRFGFAAKSTHRESIHWNKPIRRLFIAKYRKSRMFAPPGSSMRGRGLQWLGRQSGGGPRVVGDLRMGRQLAEYRACRRLFACKPHTIFEAALAHMHDAGAAHFGSARMDTGTFFTRWDPVPMDTGDWDDPVSYLADGRLRPMVQLGIQRGELTDDDLALTNEVIDRLPDLLGRAADDAPARVHGDLWSGNVMWTRDSGDVQAVLIDPAAHGGHRRISRC